MKQKRRRKDRSHQIKASSTIYINLCTTKLPTCEIAKTRLLRYLIMRTTKALINMFEPHTNHLILTFLRTEDVFMFNNNKTFKSNPKCKFSFKIKLKTCDIEIPLKTTKPLKQLHLFSYQYKFIQLKTRDKRIVRSRIHVV